MADKPKQKKNIAKIIVFILFTIAGFLLGMKIAKNLDTVDDKGTYLLKIAIVFLSFYVSLLLTTIIHEAGHLVMGLATGYKYLSFRIGSLVLQKTEQGLKFKKYSIAGTGGQCLMIPPEVKNPEDVPYFWYNFGGGFFNLLSALICVPFIFTLQNDLTKTVLIVFALYSAFTGFINLIPLDIGVANDGMNILAMAKNPYARGVLYKQFKMNALLNIGTRLKDMPDELFEYDENQKDHLSSTMPALHTARLMDEMKFDEAEKEYEKILENQKHSQLYVNEYSCELLFCKIVNGAPREEIDEIYDKELQNYVKASGKTMISRRKLLYAYYLIIEKNMELAEKEYQFAYKMEKSYPIKGDADSELAILEYVKENFNTNT